MFLHLFLSSWVFFLSSVAYSQNPYEVLGVKETASEEEIKKAYLKRARETHPDVSNLPKDQAELKFKAVQSAWDQINKVRGSETQEQRLNRSSERRQLQEKEQAKREASQILESQWSRGIFGSDTIKALPRYQSSQKRMPFGMEPIRNSKDEGEWEAIEDFIKRHQTEYLEKNPSAKELHELLGALDAYPEIVGQSVQAIRKGLTEPFESALFERAHDKNLFVDALKTKIERMGRAGVFLQSTEPSKEREKALTRPAELFAKRFGEPFTNSIGQLAKAVLENTFSQVERNSTQLHELGSLVRSFSSALPPEEGLAFLGGFLEKLDSLPSKYQVKRDLKDLKARAAAEAARIFEKNSTLKDLYTKKTSLWKRLTESIPPCEIILGKIARRLD